MQEIIEFLNENGPFFLATTDGDQPKIRPLGFVMDYNGKLCFCTNNQKEMYRQMKANPKVQLSCSNKTGVTLRITGDASFITTPEAQQKALDIMPGLSGMYSVGDGIFEVFSLKNASAYFCTMQGEKTVVDI
ncbi:MAG: pyridoxamine 5'-phosphate oxidase family protein [Eubacterium sp.]